MPNQGLELLNTTLKTISNFSSESDDWKDERTAALKDKRAFALSEMKTAAVAKRTAIKSAITAFSTVRKTDEIADVEEKMDVLTGIIDTGIHTPEQGVGFDLNELDPASGKIIRQIASTRLTELNAIRENKRDYENFVYSTNNTFSGISDALEGQFGGKTEKGKPFYALQTDRKFIEKQEKALEELSFKIGEMKASGYETEMAGYNDKLMNLSNMIDYFNMMDLVDHDKENAFVQIAEEVNLLTPVKDPKTGEVVSTYGEALNTASMYAMSGQGSEARRWLDMAQQSKVSAINYAKSAKASLSEQADADAQAAFETGLKRTADDIHGYMGTAKNISNEIAGLTSDVQKTEELIARIGPIIPPRTAKSFTSHRRAGEDEVFGLVNEYKDWHSSKKLDLLVESIKDAESSGNEKKARKHKGELSAYLLTPEGLKDIVGLDFPGAKLFGKDAEEAEYEKLLKNLLYGIEEMNRHEGQASMYGSYMKDVDARNNQQSAARAALGL